MLSGGNGMSDHDKDHDHSGPDHAGHGHGGHSHGGHSHGGHSHGGHGDHGHAHFDPSSMNERRVQIALALTAGFMVVEAAGGVISGSLALLADAAHMLTDTGALALTWFTLRLARRPADPKRTFGYGRAEIIAAFVNGIAMIALTVWIVAEAIGRIADPVEVMGTPMLIIGAAGLVVNMVSYYLLSRGESLNLRGASLHVLGDMLGSVAAIGAALIILATGWMPIDPILSVVVALLILRSAWAITREAGHVLMEGTPGDLDPEDIKADLAATVDGVEEIHHLHAWALTPENVLVTFHVRPAPGTAHMPLLTALNDRLKSRFGIDHATIQIEEEDCVDAPAAPAPG